jgi:hypothetical protein
MMSHKSSALFARFKTDEDRQENGVWVDFGDGIKVKIRRFKSKASVAARKELDKPHTEVIRRGKLAEDVAEDLLVRQIAMGVIADWEGVTDENGNNVPNTTDAKYHILKALPDFRDEIFAISVEAEHFKAAVDADAEGNS